MWSLALPWDKNIVWAPFPNSQAEPSLSLSLHPWLTSPWLSHYILSVFPEQIKYLHQGHSFPKLQFSTIKQICYVQKNTLHSLFARSREGIIMMGSLARSTGRLHKVRQLAESLEIGTETNKLSSFSQSKVWRRQNKCCWVSWWIGFLGAISYLRYCTHLELGSCPFNKGH